MEVLGALWCAPGLTASPRLSQNAAATSKAAAAKAVAEAKAAQAAAEAVGRISVPSPQSLAIERRANVSVRPGELLRKIATAAPSWTSAVVLAFWLGIASLWWGITASRLGKFRQLLHSASRASAEVQDQARSLAERLGIKDAPEVWLVPSAIPPMLWALGTRPKLLVPADLLGRLGADRRAAILVHELAHMKRRDHWVRLLEIVVSGLYWWNPLVWWSRRAP